MQVLRSWLDRLSSTVTVVSLTGLYLPVWTSDLKGIIQWSCDLATGGSMWDPTSSGWRRGEEQVCYDDIPVPASSKLPTALDTVVAGFDLSQLAPHDPAYLADWPAGIYEVSLSDAAIQARGEAVDSFEAALAEEYGRIKNVRLRTADLKVDTFKLIVVFTSIL